MGKRKLAIIALVLIVLVLSIISGNNSKNIMYQFYKSYSNSEEISDRLMEKIKSNKLIDADKYFVQGYLSKTSEKVDYDKVKNYFELAIKNINKDTSYFTKIYSYKFLSEIYIKEDNEAEAIKYAKKAFNNIPSYKYDKYYKSVWDICLPLLDTNEGRYFALDSLKEVAKREYTLNDKAKLYIHKRLLTVYGICSEYVGVIEENLRVIELAKKLDDNYNLARSTIDLGITSKKLGGTKNAISVIENVNKIKIDDKYKDADVNVLKLINLSQLEIELCNYDKALDYLNELENYEKLLKPDKIDDVEILKQIEYALINISKKNFDEASKNLEYAFEKLSKDEVISYIDKDIYYYLALAKLNDEKNNNQEAIDNYKIAEKLSREKEHKEYLEDSIKGLGNIYYKMGDIENSYKYNLELIKLQKEKSSIISKDYYNYIFYKDKHINTMEENFKIRNMTMIFAILAITLSFILYKVDICPLLCKRRLKKKVEGHIKNNEYELHYQPIINPKKNEIVGFEALLRLKIGDEIIMPNVIINEIEQCDMMGEVSIWILNKVIEEYDDFEGIDNLVENYYLSMNISLKEIEDEDILNSLKSMLQNSDLKKKSICLEITEKIGEEDESRVQNNIRQLRKSGFLIALDDFGVDYSNISLLEKFEFDILKFDKYFIDKYRESLINKIVIEASDYISDKVNKTVVIEGVEDKEQKDIIKNTKSSKFYIQGYFYSKPMEIKELKKYNIIK